ncbi:MAG: response regulator, partial [Bacteroidota bacterium]|nr:response regulator [Bacteroidota bacterium]
MENINTRVLIIDDEAFVRENIQEILVPAKKKQSEKISGAASVLFDDETEESILTGLNNDNIPVFHVDSAINGMEGVEKIKKAVAADNPYAVVFLDMRMPGWDGLETALHIREVDTKAEIIIITAYSDKSIDEIVAAIGQNVGYHCKPYASEEILQLATKAVNDYNKLRNLEKLISVVSSISLSETHLNSLLQNILDQLAMYIGSDVAVLGKLLDTHEYQQLFSIGTLENGININKLSAIISSATIQKEEVIQKDELVFVKLEDYSIFAVLNKNQRLKTEKLYLLKLFVQNAAKAIRNIQLYEELIQKEKLSAVGKALSMLMHDLRSPIKNIPVLTSCLRSEGVSSQWLDMIDVCGEQASEIFDDFLDFIRETPLHLQKVSVEQLIREGVSLAN